jgi:ADP-ribose pyrophosphatase YjhB (NUDIX family)
MTADDTNPFYLGQPKRRAGSGALILDDEEKILMVEPTYKHTWEIPGGIVEQGEDPRTACHRECLEELGLEIQPGRLLALEHQVEPPPRGDSLMFIYDGGTLEDSAAIQLQAEEIRSFRFVAADELERVTTARLARRVRQALIAHQQGGLIEMVNGEPIADR